MVKIKLSLLFFLCGFFLKAQTQSDSLKSKTFEYLFNQFDLSNKINVQDIYANAIINKAKKEKDTTRLIGGYSFKSLIYNDEKHLIYQDSIINLAKNGSNKYQPAIAYLDKGRYYYDIRDFKKALDNVLEARKFTKKHHNIELELECNHLIATLKNRLGDNDEALQILKENLRQYKKTSSKNNRLNTLKLNTYFSIAVTFNDLKQFDSTSYYNTIGFLKSLEFKDSRYKNYFRLNQGVNLFKKGNYSEALDSLDKSISTLKRINDKPNLAMAYFYIAKIYDKTFNSKKTIIYFHKVDSIFRINKDVHPKLRETYERLIRYYENIGDIENQLEYVIQLISLDSILHENEIYLNKEIIKEYDIPILISEKENIINVLKEKEAEIKNHIYWLLVLILIMLLGLYYQFHNKRIYKKRFNEIMKRENDDKIQNFVNKSIPKDLNISESLIERILIELEQFEKQKEYLNEEMSLNSLAKKIKTNANYLSRIVNLYKGESFIHYINNLRIDHTIQELKNNTVFRKYTLKAIANEVGFKKGESFSNAFFKRTGIKPSFFIKELSSTEKS